MKRSTDRILTSHSGSLPRPPELMPLLEERAAGRPVDMALFEPMVAKAIEDIVDQQLAAGLTVVNDGENSKISYTNYVLDRLSGFEAYEMENVALDLPGESADYPEYFKRESLTRGRTSSNVRCVGPIAWKDFSEVERDIRNLKTAAAGKPVEDLFLSAASPTTARLNRGAAYYKSEEEFMYALADVMKREYRAIVDAGIVLQVDTPWGVRARTDPPGTTIEVIRKELDLFVEVLNYALADIPADQARIHMCWGSDEGPHHKDIQLKDVVDILLKAKPAGMTIVGANGRHEHEWEVWKDIKVPDGKVIIAGVIDSTTNIIEHPETVAGRIERYANVLGRENVIAGVDCGFSTGAGVEEHRVERNIVWAKLKALSEGAEIATRRLWGKK